MESKAQESAPASGISANDEQLLADAAAFIDAERQRQGISLKEVGRMQIQLATLPPITPERQAKIDADVAACEERERLSRRRERLGEFFASIGKLHAQCRLHNFDATRLDQQAAIAALREYSESMPQRLENAEGIVLYGPVGTGKDHLAVSLAGIAVEKYDQRAMLINVQDWFGSIRDGISEDRAERGLIREIAAPDVLILSDPLPPIGQLSQHMATMLYRAVEQRDCRGKATWVTVNVANDKEADERFGAATWDRLCHRAWKINCSWPSYRKPARKVNCQ